MNNIVLQSLSPEILEIENPSRYFPSEYYTARKNPSGKLRFAFCFPDLYEIGMSNNAVRILYDVLNKNENVCCDRVFAVAPDFEKLLREKKVPLFTLENNFFLNELDFLGITLGCELLATNILQVLELGNIALDKGQRKETDPIVVLGGPAATNPLPFSKFVDFVYIGEGEKGYDAIIEIIKNYKLRTERIEALKKLDYLWYEGKKLAIRDINTDFGSEDENPLLKYAVVPAFQVAQDHGTAEIMRGCPNGCRFCHAGQYYKPFRQRNISTIERLVDQSVNSLGYREITLSSLSSGDYPDLDKMIAIFNKKYKSRGVSFSLPSLRVSTFSLNILEQISEVRKSGLTFAIETPMLENQHTLNKEVPLDAVISIIQVARQRGWKLAKFYFMVGMPFIDKETEIENIKDFLLKIYQATKINMNINVGTFIPKAHTPFERVRQYSIEESETHLKALKNTLRASIPGIKVSYHDPRISFLEGVISRGDASTCKLIELAYKKGCRLDAWDEYLNFDSWQQAMDELNYTYKNEYSEDGILPWSSVSMRVSPVFLKKELGKASEQLLTSICNSSCDHNCGVCGSKAKTISADNTSISIDDSPSENEANQIFNQAVFIYKKTGRALFNSHIAVMRQFDMAFQRSGLHIKFTEGFNPKPRMEFVNPLSMGIEGENELLLVELPVEEINQNSVERLNSVLAEGYTVKSIRHISMPDTGKKISLASKMLGSIFKIEDVKDKEIEEKLIQAQNTDRCKITKEAGKYTLETKGELNIFKTFFPEMSKFRVAGNCKITRTNILMEEL